MNAIQVALGTGFLAVGIAWLAEVHRDRSRPPEQRRNFKTRSLRGPTLAGLFWLLLAAWWLGRGLLN
jgi:hypothetical protein